MRQNDPFEICYTRNGHPSAFLPVRMDRWPDLIRWIAAPSAGKAGTRHLQRTTGANIHWLPLEHTTIVAVCRV
jgi:hypothetical protein